MVSQTKSKTHATVVSTQCMDWTSYFASRQPVALAFLALLSEKETRPRDSWPGLVVGLGLIALLFHKASGSGQERFPGNPSDLGGFIRSHAFLFLVFV